MVAGRPTMYACLCVCVCVCVRARACVTPPWVLAALPYQFFLSKNKILFLQKASNKSTSVIFDMLGLLAILSYNSQ